MQLQCPECNASFHLREARNEQDWRSFVDLLVQFPQSVQVPLLQYMQLFKPKKQQQVRSSVMLRHAKELLPMVKDQQIERNRKTYTVRLGQWSSAMLYLAGKANLQTPLKGNGYLLETLANHAERTEAKQEQAELEKKRYTPNAGSTDTNTGHRSGTPRQIGKIANGEASKTSPDTDMTKAQKDAHLKYLRQLAGELDND